MADGSGAAFVTSIVRCIMTEKNPPAFFWEKKPCPARGYKNTAASPNKRGCGHKKRSDRGSPARVSAFPCRLTGTHFPARAHVLRAAALSVRLRLPKTTALLFPLKERPRNEEPGFLYPPARIYKTICPSNVPLPPLYILIPAGPSSLLFC